MAQQFHTLTVNYLDRQTDDSIIIGFDMDGLPESTFHFLAGQNISIRIFSNGEELRRTYSICSCPSEGIIRIGVRGVKDGIFSNIALNQLKIGDTLDIMPPVGNFTIQGKNAADNQFVFFATGSGITPIISMIKDKLEKDNSAVCTLFYSNRNIASMMFREELDGIKNNYTDRLQVVYLFSREFLDADLFYGRMTAEKSKVLLETFVPDFAGSQFFICGPQEQTIAIKDLLTKTLNVPINHVHFELFHTGSLPEVVQEEHIDFTGTAEVTVRLDGKETTFNLGYDKMSILEAGLKQGLDLPYSCKGGVCCTCRAHLSEGQVKMDQNFALEEDELEEGFILTCQSHPRSGKLFVDYDY